MKIAYEIAVEAEVIIRVFLLGVFKSYQLWALSLNDVCAMHHGIDQSTSVEAILCRALTTKDGIQD